jgi:hypothetical protein
MFNIIYKSIVESGSFEILPMTFHEMLNNYEVREASLAKQVRAASNPNVKKEIEEKLHDHRETKKYISDLVMSMLLCYLDVDGLKIVHEDKELSNFTNEIHVKVEPWRVCEKSKRLDSGISLCYSKYSAVSVDNNHDIDEKKLNSLGQLFISLIKFAANSNNGIQRDSSISKDVLLGYVFHLDDFVMELRKRYSANADFLTVLPKEYENDQRFRLFTTIFKNIKSKAETILSQLDLRDQVNVHFAFGHKNGAGSYFFFPTTLDKFAKDLDSERLNEMIKNPSDILKSGVGLLAQMQAPARAGSLWTVFSDTEFSKHLNYVHTKKHLWEIEKKVFFTNATQDSKYLMAAIPFIAFEDMNVYVYLDGVLNSLENVDSIRKVIGLLSFYLFSIAESTKNTLALMSLEADRTALKKHFISSDLRGDQLLSLAVSGDKAHEDYTKKLLQSFKVIADSQEPNPRLIFNFSKEGWYEQYFSYAFTEDVYHIALRLVHKIVDNLSIDSEAKRTIKDTLKVFYSFQENAKASSLNYRDHLIHQFQVFLIGLKIMSSKWWYETVAKNNGEKIDGIQWSITALFHDIGYPFEKLEGINRQYIEKLLLLAGDSISRDKVSQDILLGKVNNSKINGKSTKHQELLELFYEMIKIASNAMNFDKEKEHYYWFFKKLFIEDRKHAVTSALYVYHTMLNKGIDDADKSEILSAILFHDKQVWIESLKSRHASISDLAPLINNMNLVDNTNNAVDPSPKGKIFALAARHYLETKNIYTNTDERKIFEKTLDSYYAYFSTPSWRRNTIEITDQNLWLFVLHRIFQKEPLLNKHEIRWEHKINPREHPMQFLLLISDALQERGREIGDDKSISECFPDIKFSADASGGLFITLIEPADCFDSESFRLELMKAYVDLSLLKSVFDEAYYDVSLLDHKSIKISLKTAEAIK